MARASTLGAAASRSGPPRASLLSDRALVLLREARWLLLCTVALFVALILLSYDRTDPGWSHAASVRDIHNLGGHVGAWAQP
jgi:S-DNA-T family DNA segregation ATPase FtsK/SpoIIIE